jgi:protein required for attachment to host cells
MPQNGEWTTNAREKLIWRKVSRCKTCCDARNSRSITMREPHRKTWIVVANGGHARIFLNTHRDEDLSELPLEDARDPHVKGQKPGHVHHTPEFKPTQEVRDEGQFLNFLADTLQTGVASKNCDQLVLVASATAMGHLRKALNSNTSKHIVAEIVHDYTHQTKDFIYAQVKDKLPL